MEVVGQVGSGLDYLYTKSLVESVAHVLPFKVAIPVHAFDLDLEFHYVPVPYLLIIIGCLIQYTAQSPFQNTLSS